MDSTAVEDVFALIHDLASQKADLRARQDAAWEEGWKAGEIRNAPPVRSIDTEWEHGWAAGFREALIAYSMLDVSPSYILNEVESANVYATFAGHVQDVVRWMKEADLA